MIIQLGSHWTHHKNGGVYTMIIQLGSHWTHHKNGGVYTIYDITNDHSESPDYPLHISFIGRNGKRWSKPLDNFLDTMQALEVEP